MTLSSMAKLRLNGFQLKTIALVLMMLDHIHQYIPDMPIVLNWAGRIVAPIFFFLMVEGFRKTRNRKRYITRMWIAAVVMDLGSLALMSIFPGGPVPITNNIFISLGCGLLLLQAWEWMTRREYPYPSILFFFVAMMGGMLSEAGVLGIVMTMIFYSLSHSPRKMTAAYILSMLMLTIGMDALASTAPLNWHTVFFESYQWMMIGAIVPILMYNGKRGHSAPWIKYAFYIIYPLHIWVLYLISFQWR